MLMFRFWTSDSRGSDKTAHVDQPMHEFGKPVQPLISEALLTSPSRPAKRRRPSNAAAPSHEAASSLAVKRPKRDDGEASPRKKVALTAVPEAHVPPVITSEMAGLERAKDVIQHQFSHAVLLKHNELRLINQELAKCQVALEQLRRCHLMPYPVNLPTPEQMLNISSGSGPALQTQPGEKVPQWAPPFGVTDGPYARHYAKWLIPDAKFDGVQSQMPAQAESARFRNSMDGRSTRNSFAEVGASQPKGRPGRGLVGQKLHALSAGYPQPKDKAGPCILKRADGKTVKLVCIDCKRDNFSSTQGFINHCRIAHKRDFKSHEEAAVACGHPIEVEENSPVVGVEEKPVAVVNSAVTVSGLAHPFARENAMSESEACFSVVSRINQSLEMYRSRQLQGTQSIPAPSKDSLAAQGPSSFAPSADSPHLSRLLQSRGKSLNLSDLVRDAKIKFDLDDLASPDEVSSDEVETAAVSNGQTSKDQTPSSLVPRMRIPARTTMSPVPLPASVAGTRPASSKGRAPLAPYATPIPTPAPRALPDRAPEMAIEDEMDIDMSPNTAISNNAPSLVSDDGEYDDSVDGSSDESEVDDDLDAESVSDVAEIGFDDEVGPTAIRHHRGSAGTGTGTTVRLHKEDNKHVTFVSPVKEAGNQRRAHGRHVT